MRLVVVAVARVHLAEREDRDALGRVKGTLLRGTFARATRRLRAGHHVGNGDVRVERRVGLEGALGRAGRAGLARLGLARALRRGDGHEPVVSHSLGARAETNTLGVEVILGDREGRRVGEVRRGKWGVRDARRRRRYRAGGPRGDFAATRAVEEKILDGTADAWGADVDRGYRGWAGAFGVGRTTS